MPASYPSFGRYARAGRAAQRRVRLRVLVVAPHPDDDVIGCGGTLARLARRRARVTVVYVTDGSASHPGSQRFSPAAIRELREIEARKALVRLGIGRHPRFLRAPDSGLDALRAPQQATIVAALIDALERSRVDIVLVPWIRDPHADHIAAAVLAREALARCRRRPAVYQYGVWLQIRGDAADLPPRDVTVLDIRLTPAELRRKRLAIAEHRTQLGEVIDDDPDGFRIDAATLAKWLVPFERFYRVAGQNPAPRLPRTGLGCSREKTSLPQRG